MRMNNPVWDLNRQGVWVNFGERHRPESVQIKSCAKTVLIHPPPPQTLRSCLKEDLCQFGHCVYCGIRLFLLRHRTIPPRLDTPFPLKSVKFAPAKARARKTAAMFPASSLRYKVQAGSGSPEVRQDSRTPGLELDGSSRPKRSAKAKVKITSASST